MLYTYQHITIVDCTMYAMLSIVKISICHFLLLLLTVPILGQLQLLLVQYAGFYSVFMAS